MRSKSRYLVMMAAALIASLTLASAAARPYLEAALQTAKWIRSSALRTESGMVWPADPRDAKTVNTGLYSGTSG